MGVGLWGPSVRHLRADVHLSCRTSVAERQGRSSRVWSSSTAVPAVTREGSSSTKSSASVGLSQANSCRRRERRNAYFWLPAWRGPGSPVVTFSRLGKKRL